MTGSTTRRRLVGVALAACAVTGLTIASAGAASAATSKNGSVESGEFGMYYHSDYAGCAFDLIVSDDNFANDYFRSSTSSTCSGQGQTTNNNTASNWNRDVFEWYVYTGASHTSLEGSLPVGWYGNFSANYKNAVTSAYWYDAN